jgi:hypothetical protein
VNPRGSFNVGLNNGLIEAKHYRAMGEAVWLFLYLLDNQTRRLDKNGLGKVSGGMPIRDSDIAGALGCSRRTVIRWRDILFRCGYITAIRTPYGYSYAIAKPKKWSQATKTDVTGTPHLSTGRDVQVAPRDVTRSVERCDIPCTNKEEVQEITRETIEPESVSLDFPSEMANEIWNYYVEQIGKHPAICTFTPSRKKIAAARFAEALQKAGGYPDKAIILMKCAVDALRDSAWHNGKNDAKTTYNEWEHLFGSAEKFEQWLGKAPW